MLRRRLVAPLLLLAAGACQRTQPAPAPAAGAPPVAHAAQAPAPGAHPGEPATAHLPVCDSGGSPPLVAARRAYDAAQYEAALACAAQAAALDADSPDAHAERGAALAALERTAEAQVAFARALALDPDHAEALLGAAHLFAVQLPSSREFDELGALYAERGYAKARHDPALRREFALLSAMAHNDLGDAEKALERASWVLGQTPGDKEALYEKALALFERCRFGDAKAAFGALAGDPERGAHAHQHLGLLAEREGRLEQAEAHFQRARALAPGDFPAPVAVSADEFRAELSRALAELPADMRRDLDGIPVTAEDLPSQDDLLAGEPPLSPSILGLFRGPPLGEPCDGSETPCRSVALYRKNLARATKSRQELNEQIRVTLLHEVGHLRGEDDLELAARGLE